uniref:Chromo shadow domain-containing protein n=1 Tax=Schizaphis graminum TaxID=13262 RepID=A0A2S2PI80_SCHGA
MFRRSCRPPFEQRSASSFVFRRLVAGLQPAVSTRQSSSHFSRSPCHFNLSASRTCRIHTSGILRRQVKVRISVRDSAANMVISTRYVPETPEPMEIADGQQPLPGRLANADGTRGMNTAIRGRRNTAIRGRNWQRTRFPRDQPETVTEHFVQNNNIFYKVRWSDGTSRLVESSVMRDHYPQLLLDFYEAMFKSDEQ